MKLLILVQSEVTYQHLRSRFSKHEIAPFSPNDRAIRLVLGSFEADAAIVENRAPWAQTFERKLNALDVVVIPFDDDFTAIIEEVEKLALQFDEDEDDEEEEPEPKELKPYSPTIVTEKYQLHELVEQAKEEDPAAVFLKNRMLRKEGHKQPETAAESATDEAIKEPKQEQPSPLPKASRSKLFSKDHTKDTKNEHGTSAESKDESKDESFSEPVTEPKEKKSMPKLPKLSLPKMPDVPVPNILKKPSIPKLPKLPKLNLPSTQHTLDPADTVDLDLVNPENRVVYRDQVVGTAIVSVMGISPGVGTTHTSILIANYLARQKERVAVVEVCDSYAFARLERSYHGVPDGTILETDHFEAFDVYYFKSSDDLDLSLLFAEGFTFIVLDLGTQDSGEGIKEFFRSSIPVLVGGGAEWKQQDIYRFCRQYKKRNQSNWNIAVPLVEKETISDIKKRMETTVKQIVALPYHPDPFDDQSDTDHALKSLLQLRGKKRFGIFR
ncbi:hypothetical protein ACVWZB_004756 [Paenibacillus polymyxa]